MHHTLTQGFNDVCLDLSNPGRNRVSGEMFIAPAAPKNHCQSRVKGPLSFRAALRAAPGWLCTCRDCVYSRRADEGGNHRATESRRADGLHLHAIARFVEARKVIGDLFPVSDRSIVAGIETED